MPRNKVTCKQRRMDYALYDLAVTAPGIAERIPFLARFAAPGYGLAFKMVDGDGKVEGIFTSIEECRSYLEDREF